MQSRPPPGLPPGPPPVPPPNFRNPPPINKSGGRSIPPFHSGDGSQQMSPVKPERDLRRDLDNRRNWGSESSNANTRNYSPQSNFNHNVRANSTMATENRREGSVPAPWSKTVSGNSFNFGGSNDQQVR